MSDKADINMLKYNIMSFNNMRYKLKRKILEQEHNVNNLISDLKNHRNKMYNPIIYGLDYYDNEPLKEYKPKEKIKTIIPHYFVLNKKMKLISENQEQDLNLTKKGVKSVEWLNNKCKMTFNPQID